MSIASDSLEVPCPHCLHKQSVRLPRLGTYIRCPQCDATFLVIDEETLPAADSVQFQPTESATVSGTQRVVARPQSVPANDTTQRLATISLFLGGLSLSLTCLPPTSLFTAVPGLLMGIMSLNSSRRPHAVTGIIVNGIAMSVTILLLIAAMQQVAIRE